ncbi:EAL domain-containing protein [Hirschia baltica]|uniref:Diguanylate phosphodiesterase n=1 Tax=Hirschia baltica (strain ATCC 49814 / DSM 5838 / IFAM 1418) TaxID=582402 RepID=C6XQR4_HIRBI|nr:EAL domain-containing protein [Hirschia baltica]ACT58670.1 diguanylate phosphodiesterase [Hirschia baltica ATCC 49814]
MPIFAHVMLALTYITACIVGGAALHRYLGVDLTIAGLIAAAIGLAVTQFHVILSRSGAAKEGDDKFQSLRNELKKLVQRVDETERRADELRDEFEREIADRRESLVTEMRGLETMISRMSDSFETRLSSVRENGTQASVAGSSALEAVRDALRQNRVDLHLQPIVTLPQRRVRFYEGFTRLRRADGEVIMPGEFLAEAESAGLLGVVDNMLLFRCVQIVRRLSERDRRVGVFCNVAMSSLEDETYFPQFLEFMRENQDLAGAMIFEIGVRNFNNRSNIAARNMGRLAELGFRFSLDKGEGLDFDLPELQSSGVRFVKVTGDRLLSELVPGGQRPVSGIVRSIAPEDVSAVFMRYGVDLVAEKVEDEKSVIELLDFEIPFGQGHVFGAPRPIKGSLLEETAPPPEFIRRVNAANNINA